ncbi:type IV pilin N-terminal domain-containing protein [uncultured Methanomethylovorans sp.]|uniref:type IV pilin N-terminal domain-containing protein n=1 Tax=uncultured Methanomethylovorans sp. TaxID=183759 RepID=UPI002AA84A0F|nr:type IV pilin N-terminal domain-containing protein [uncultured Methanomethylovorans sp.]
MVKLFSNEKAVSPVIGVMLMIVVTVVLAAAVSSFASSTSTQDAAPQATFSVDSSSQSDGYIQMSHLGGDILTKANLKIAVSTGSRLSGYVNMSNVTFSPESDYLRPGDSVKIAFLKTEYEGDDRATFKSPDVKLNIYVGTPYKIKFIDTNSGQTIYETSTVMNP